MGGETMVIYYIYYGRKVGNENHLKDKEKQVVVLGCFGKRIP